MSALSTLIYFTASLVSIGASRKSLTRLLPDVPNARSSHHEVKPRAGGLIILALLSVEIARRMIFGAQSVEIPITAILGIMSVAVLGLIDDFRPLSVATRLFAQTVFVVLIVYNSPLVEALGGAFEGKVLAIALSSIAGVAFINFYNFMDGIDGLVAGCVIVQLLYLGLGGQLDIPLISAAIVGGFLFWNWHPAKIFLGDCGSYLLGALLLHLGSLSASPIDIGRFVVLTLPLTLDPTITLIRRVFLRRDIFSSHRDHIYQLLATTPERHAIVSGGYILFQLALCLALAKWQLG